MRTQIRDARLTGAFYLGLAITGLGGQLLKSQLFDSGDPAETLASLRGDEFLARAAIAVELGVVITQALAAIWFYRLFRGVDAFAAGALAAFGLVNSMAILASAGAMATALDVALDGSLAPAGDGAPTAQLFWTLSDNLWGVAGVFFGLWLIPMGLLVLWSHWMPRVLGWLLVAGGIGYVLSAFVDYLVEDAGVAVDALTIPATIGELWIVFYLLIRGVRRPAAEETRVEGGVSGSVMKHA